MTPADWTPMRHRLRCWSVRNPWAAWMVECAAYLLALALLMWAIWPGDAFAVTAETAAGDREIAVWYLLVAGVAIVSGWLWRNAKKR